MIFITCIIQLPTYVNDRQSDTALKRYKLFNQTWDNGSSFWQKLVYKFHGTLYAIVKIYTTGGRNRDAV